MTTSQALKHERKGSFFKLIDSFASEIGMLKKEMGKKTKPSEEKKNKDEILGLGEEVGGLFLQASPCAGIRGGLDGARDSGYDSLHRRLSVLDRLVHTHAVWLQLGLSHQEATCILQSQPTGTFVVRKSASLQRKVISLRMDKDAGVPVKDFLVKENQYTFALEGSGLSFADLFRLVAFCCISRDVLPFTLKLPEAIASARSPADLEEVSKLGAGFWDAHLSHRRKESGSLSGITAPDRPAPPAQRSFSLATTPRQPWLQTRTPSEIECCQSNGALCFINPLFLKVHHRENENRTTSNPSTTAAQDPGEEPEKNNPESTNRHIDHSGTDSPQVRSEDQSGSTLSAKINPESLSRNIQLQDGNSETSSSSQPLSACVSRSPPPRPPPPRFAPRQSAAPLRQRSMPEKIPWIIVPKEKMEGRERSSSLLSRLSSSLSSSPSSSPPKKLSISSPISIPLPCLSISLSSLSSSQRWSKTSPTSSQEDAQCHLALEENTIEKALLRAKLLQTNFTRTPALDSSSPPDPSAMKKSKRAEVAGREDSVDGCTGCQRLSDMSISTDSSDSLDLSQSSAFFLPPLHDPCLPTVDDFNTHLPLSLPPSHLPYPSMEEEEDDDDDEDEEDQDYDVSLESDQDQDQDLTMVPPGKRTKRRHSASALVLQKALRGKFRKMSGIFNSLLTPERRAIRRVVELSKHRGSYFGCLVHDYLSYMGEGAGTQAWQSYASGLELLQTVRQFITQMKSYLRQSSELEPPIESLIPEDHIDRVLEKSLHKCILKPLKSVVSVALKEFQVRSGEWQELKENLSLAKQRQPQEMGVSGVLPPDRVTLDKIKQKFREMVKEYSPEKKVIKLLSVCKLIYNTMQDSSGRPYGADDFLPMLTYVLAQCDMPQLDNEILYMMELLDPSLLHGEGGYYLTSAYGAMSLIRHFQEEQAARMLSSETRDTLHQWHHRRTTIRSAPAPSIDDFQNYLRVALQELDNGCTAKTLPVRPHATVEEVCQLCANKFKVTDPESYGLFLVTNGSSQQLAPDNHPQKIKAELHSRSQANPFYFVFRTVAYGNPSASAPANLNELPVNSDPLAELNSLSIDPLAPSSEPSLSSDLSPSLSLSLSPSHSISV